MSQTDQPRRVPRYDDVDTLQQFISSVAARRAGVVRLSFEVLASLLNLPIGNRLTAAVPSIDFEGIEFRVEGPLMPLAPTPGAELARVPLDVEWLRTPCFTWRGR